MHPGDPSLFASLARGRPGDVAAAALAFALRSEPDLVTWLWGQTGAPPPEGAAPWVEEVAAPAADSGTLQIAWTDAPRLRLELRIGAYAAPPESPATAGPTLYVIPSSCSDPDAWPAPCVTWQTLAERVRDYAAAGLLRDADRALHLIQSLDQAAVSRNLEGTARAFLTAVDAHLVDRLGPCYAPADTWLEGTWDEEPYSGFYFQPALAPVDAPRYWLGVYAGPEGATLRLELAGDVQRSWPPEDWPIDAAAVATQIEGALASRSHAEEA